MLTRSQLKNIFNEYGFRPLKRLGENYLIDGNIRDKILKEASAGAGDTVLEIGPGLGALTEGLAGSGAAVFAVEIDKKAYGALTDLVGNRFPNLRLIHGDVLKFDLSGAADPGKKIKIVGNLPYYITTPIIEYIIENRKSVSSALVTVQREVANRLLALPGTEDYSSISCYVRYYTSPVYIHTIKNTAFYPEPEVDSSLVRLDILDKPSVETGDEALFFKIIRSAFNQRRKSIVNSLSREAALSIPKEELAGILKRAGIEPSVRPERLGLAEFARIAKLTKQFCCGKV